MTSGLWGPRREWRLALEVRAIRARVLRNVYWVR